MNINNEYCGRKRAHEDEVIQQNKQQKVTYEDSSIARIDGIIRSLLGIQVTVRSGLPLDQLQRVILSLQVEHICALQNSLPRDVLSCFVDLLIELCYRDIAIRRSIGQQVTTLVRENFSS
jgi:hypothetical protein